MLWRGQKQVNTQTDTERQSRDSNTNKDRILPTLSPQLFLTSNFSIFYFFVFFFWIVVLSCVLMMHYRLRQEHAALEKDKIQGGSLRRMWSKFSGGGGGGSHRYRYGNIQLRILFEYLCIIN